MTIREVAKKLKFIDNKFLWKVGNNSNEVVSRSKLISLLEKNNILDEDEQDSAITELKTLCQIRVESEEEIDNENPIISKIKEINLYKDIKKYKIQSDRPPVVYYNNNNVLEPLGTPGELTPDFLCSFIRNSGSELRNTIDSNFKQFFINEKNKYPSSSDVRKKVFSVYDIETDAEVVDVPEDLHPVVLEGVEYPSLIQLPFFKEEVLKTDLNPYLSELLDRVSDHEYLCAIIYGSLIGYQFPYILYLYGTGGEGKTSFIKMLGQLCKGSITIMKKTSTVFSHSSMHGKAIIHVSENQNPYLYAKDELLQISGGSYVNIERKGQDGYSGVIRGLIIADSNINPSLSGDESERRRFRYFEFLKNKESKVQLIQSEYVNKLGLLPNKTLNYFRLCYEKLVDSGKLIKEPPSLETNLVRFRDNVSIYKCAEFINIYKNQGYVFKPNLTCGRAQIIIELEKKYKDPYIKVIFEKVLMREGVVIMGDNYINWGKDDGIDENINNSLSGVKL